MKHEESEEKREERSSMSKDELLSLIELLKSLIDRLAVTGAKGGDPDVQEWITKLEKEAKHWK
jgi:acetylornithine deacetylase/succinyl-diaminopimelate desuccinylase-like protein